jgi:Domain of unknown function (DUF4337)
MAEASEHLEHMQHAAHAGEHGHDGAEHHDPTHSRLPTYAGITMAVLGVILSFASAKVGGERTLLVKTMVEQEDAHMRYITQDLKHRVAVLSLRQLRATLPALAAGRTAVPLDKDEVLILATTIERYGKESAVAALWSDAYSPAVRAHMDGQELYEWGMLSSEIGIVIASVSLLLRNRALWLLAIALGSASVVILIFSYVKTEPVIRATEEKTAEAAKVYTEMRAADKTTAADAALVKEILETYGAQ